MKKIYLGLALSIAVSAMGQNFTTMSASQFHQLTQSTSVPVIVELGEPGCPYCADLKDTFNQLAPQYTESQVRLVYVSAPGTDLNQYIGDGYPTTRVFIQGKVQQAEFIGSDEQSNVKTFIDQVIQGGREVANTGSALFCPMY